jgi:hypothetical protein
LTTNRNIKSVTTTSQPISSKEKGSNKKDDGTEAINENGKIVLRTSPSEPLKIV